MEIFLFEYFFMSGRRVKVTKESLSTMQQSTACKLEKGNIDIDSNLPKLTTNGLLNVSC